jgi:hypothetical protein
MEHRRCDFVRVGRAIVDVRNIVSSILISEVHEGLQGTGERGVIQY